jgi:hypothetical protein
MNVPTLRHLKKKNIANSWTALSSGVKDHRIMVAYWFMVTGRRRLGPLTSLRPYGINYLA